MNKFSYPKKIICLSNINTEVLNEIGASELIVGVSEFVDINKVNKKKILVLNKDNDDNILDIIKIKPDLVFTWSNLQCEISQQLIVQGIDVVAFNPYTIDSIISMILQIGGIVGRANHSEKLVEKIYKQIETIQKKSKKIKNKPRVYFEEWYDPIITHPKWVSEIIELSGGIDIFKEKSENFIPRSRIINDSNIIVDENPDIMFFSWRETEFNPQVIKKRKNWNSTNAVANNDIYNINANDILNPGINAITKGLDYISKTILDWSSKN